MKNQRVLLPVVGRVSFAIVCVLLVGCAAPEESPLVHDEVVQTVLQRGTSVSEVRQALELAEFGPLPVARPTWPDSWENLDPDQGDFWRACALAFDPQVRGARRRVLALREASSSVGSPQPLGAGGRMLDLDDPERDSVLNLTFDLLGVLGLGPSEAARNLNHAEERAALGELERAVWSAWHRVDRDRVRHGSALVRHQIFSELWKEVEEDQRRIRLLGERGRLNPGILGAAEAVVHGLGTHVARLEVAAARSRVQLAATAGLVPGNPWLGRVSERTVEQVLRDHDGRTDPDGVTLLERHPRLRLLRLEYALAEARVRRVAAESWPSLRLGPHLKITPDEWIQGGLFAVQLPFPGSVQGLVDAALERRASAREKVEDGLVRALGSVQYGREALENSRRVLDLHAPAQTSRSAQAWRATRARFSVDEKVLESWIDVLERRMKAIAALVDARESTALAAIDYSQACGPRKEGE